MAVDHIGPDQTVYLTLFNAVIQAEDPRMLERHDLRWVSVEEK